MQIYSEVERWAAEHGKEICWGSGEPIIFLTEEDYLAIDSFPKHSDTGYPWQVVYDDCLNQYMVFPRREDREDTRA